MADILQVPRQPDGQSYYQSSGPLKSSPSSSSLFLDSAPLSSSPRHSPTPFAAEHNERISTSPPAITLPTHLEPSFHDLSDSQSSSSTPSGSVVSLADKFKTNDDVDFPDYSGTNFYNHHHDFDASHSSDEPVESVTTSTTRSDSPLPTPTVSDDTAIKQPPSRHVDYLSHDWREEDIWSSWRHIVSQRKVYGQRSRLENASWRTWAKSKYHLRTVSPETLNWLKESDVTWLYGPLKPAESHPLTSNMSEPASHLSTRGSFVNKKPILKKRSMSEVMLQRSISASSLLKQAAASVQAQQGRESRKSALRRAHSGFVDPTFTSSETPSVESIDYFTSRSSSNIGTPYESQEKRHIRFDDKVEQCIAVECKESEFDDTIGSEADADGESSSSASSSDDGVIMMKRKRRPGLKRRSTGSSKGSRASSHNGRKTIETLPATTLKFGTESPDVSEGAQHHHKFGNNWVGSQLSPSPSQETLRPSHPSSNFLLGTDDNEGEANETDSSWSFGANNPKSSLGASSSSEELPMRSRREEIAAKRARNATPAPVRDEDYSIEGMRRTNSGMFMPYDEDEDDMMAVGLFGRVSETINTAKDIAHVIWNVGWRK